MKHLLSGVAIAAALAIAVPAWAQAPKPDAAAPTAAAPASTGAPMASKQRHKRIHHRMASRRVGRRGKAGGDTATEQLNREELARLQGGGMPAAPGPMNAGAGQGGPRASGH